MGEEIIGMSDMLAIFEVTDAQGIDREAITVPLEKEDPGAVYRLPSGKVEIVVPRTVPIQEWLSTLKARLEELGFQATS